MTRLDEIKARLHGVAKDSKTEPGKLITVEESWARDLQWLLNLTEDMSTALRLVMARNYETDRAAEEVLAKLED